MPPILDRRIEFDEASRQYPIRALLRINQIEQPARSYTWDVGITLDQGNEGACVGFAWAHELAARPVPVRPVSEYTARSIYRIAQTKDEWPGENYSGTSVLAGAKTVEEMAFIREYRWAFGLDDLVRAIAYKGPAVLGLNWYTGMMRPDTSGRLRLTGQVEGGHAILAPRVTGERYKVLTMRRRIYLYNSWGQSDGWPWGWLTWDDMERLLNESGEACIPVMRSL